ncbi:M50 family metallopeptidase [Candidatus Stoquefichus massiliensis]|uniref:M50 family metallopeptidase n=1 Tax=Candidatus Stoquefichus massiliensis TaxID=1470350 RepID=UPI0004847D7B|nr:site-2 protease family protein [Candidatus Stoquefichus massiliensis]
MQTIINIIVFLLILGSIIIIHELGHFLAAKFFGVYCSQFSIGFGPKIWSKKGKETEYELRALPFGGFVAMAGEADQEDNEEMKDVPIERTLKGIQTYKKVIIFLAGVFMNFVLALVVTLGVNLVSGQLPVNVAQIGTIPENSPAQQAGLKENDIIQQVDVVETGQSILVSSYDDLQLTQDNLNTTSDTLTLKVTVLRDQNKEVVDVKVNYNQDDGKYKLGISQATRHMNIAEAFQYTFVSLGTMSMAIFTALGQLVTKFSETVTQLSGPAGIYQITAQVTETGQVAYLLNLLALLSVNVGIFNLMPIPGLDGCQVLFAVVEKIIGREIPEKLKLTLQMVGLGLVMLLMVFVTYQDISRMFG